MGELRFLRRPFRPRENNDDKGGGKLDPEDPEYSDNIILLTLVFIFIIVASVILVKDLITR